jgi:hypothetical protein
MAGESWYESAVASLFTLEMGFQNGRVADAEEAHRRGTSVLLHQSPLDHLLGDALAGWDGRYFLIEFKRTANDLTTELGKPLRRQLLTDLGAAYRKMSGRRRTVVATHLESAGIELSEGDVERGSWLFERTRAAHFLAHGTRDDGNLDIKIAPYSTLLSASLPDFTASQPHFRSFGAFFGALTAEATSDEPPIGLTLDEFVGYLARMLAATPDGEGEGGATDESPGCIALASKHGCASLPFSGWASLRWVLSQSLIIRTRVNQISPPTPQQGRGTLPR